MSEHSRRTVVRGAAWSVPVIAVAAQAPAFAVSPVRQGLRFDLACGNTGSQNDGCGFPKALQVPFIFTNNTGANLVVRIDSMVTKFKAGTVNEEVTLGVSGQGIFATTGTSPTANNTCSTTIAAGVVNGKSTCGGEGSIIIGSDPNPQNFVIVSAFTGQSSNFSTTISYSVLNADCTVIQSFTGQTSGAISNVNCL